MAREFWVTCPNWNKPYYVSTSIEGLKVDLMCPFCKDLFPNPTSKVPSK